VARILLCGINYAPDLIGVAKYTTEMCGWLTKNGHDVHVVTAPPYYPEWTIRPDSRIWLYRSEVRNGVSLLRAPIYVPKTPSGATRLLHHASFALTSAGPVLSAALRIRPHLMFCVAPSLMSAAVVALTARRIKAASWLHLQDFEIDAAFDLGILRNQHLRRPMLSVERRILRAFDRVSTIAPQMVHHHRHRMIWCCRARR
jgi:colanic acid biosynthesis glycosyl transferase WcaI